jgi:hypothetical protein
MSGQIKSRIVFLFGAGSSVDAGIPDTYEFVTMFANDVKTKDSKLHDSLTKILKIRSDFNEKNYGRGRKKVDIEQLMVTLEHLRNKNEEILLDFYENKVFSSQIEVHDIPKLQSMLQDFIRKKVVVEDERKLDYLKELINFIPPPLEIYSVNYDTCIEQLSYSNRLKYTDGFDIYWDPSNFEDQADIKLFKLHGSIIWYETENKEYLKIPVKAFVDDKQIALKLVTGEDVKPLLVYPMQKWEYVEPLTELQIMFKKRLVDAETKILVVVGYSFRDDYIVHMIWDAARKNNDLHIILVSPNAQDIYQNRLRFIDDKKTKESRIAQRVVCLPYPFSNIINLLRNHYILSLDSCIFAEKRAIENEKYGMASDWENVLKLCINCEFGTKAEQIVREKLREIWWDKNTLWLEYKIPEKITLSFQAFLHSTIAKDAFADRWLERLNRSCECINVDNLGINNLTNSMFSLCFYIGDHSVSLVEMRDLILRLLAMLENKKFLRGTKFKSELNMIIENSKKLGSFLVYIGRFTQPIPWDKYYELRRELQTPITTQLKMFDGTIKEENEGNIKTIVLQTERKCLEEILDGKKLTFHLAES